VPLLEDVSIGEVERELAQLRQAPSTEGGAPDLRMSTMTHLAWVPPEWYDRALETLHGMGERHPSRTILLVPEPDAGETRIDAELELERFPLEQVGRRVCAEVVILRLKGARAQAPASIVEPLLISDLPVFCRWRGEPPWGTAPFEQLVDMVDRLVVNSSEWDDLPYAYGKLVKIFDRAAVSDLAWSRTLGWRRSLAELWPEIAEVRGLRVEGPLADALLLQAWLRARLGTEVELDHESAGELVEAVALDGQEVAQPRGEQPTPSDLLAGELDRFGRDPVYEQAVRAATA
jgi:glucose-6-phosphate dehydrogenase assembly protein OpcA